MTVAKVAILGWFWATVPASFGGDAPPISEPPIGEKIVAFQETTRHDRPARSGPRIAGGGTWPRQTSGQVTAVTLADLDRDGRLEVIANSLFDGVYVWNHEGQPFPGWPFSSSYVASASPAVADLDGDGSLEIAVTANYRLYVFRTNGTLYPGWGGFLPGVWPGSAAFYDLDRDGDLEILAAYNAAGATRAGLYVWHHNAILVSGWPQFVAEPVKGTPAVADLDSDGEPEIVLSGNFDHNVYVWRADGTTFPGWPQHDDEFSEAYCSASIGDVDADGDMEIVSAGGTKLFVRHHDGTIASGWPRNTITTIDGSPALADIDDDGDLEIFLGSSMGGRAYGWHHDGTYVKGWPIQLGGPGQIMIDGNVAPTPAVGDVNGDGQIDIVIASGDSHEVYAFSWDGVRLADNWPKRLDEPYQFVASPVLADADGDGDIEVAIGTRGGWVYLWDETAAFDNSLAKWPMFRHDLQQTGWYEGLRRGDLDGDGRVDLADYSDLRNCLAGPGLHMSPDGCGPDLFARADLDGDDDVDIRDYAVFQYAFAPRPK